MARVFTPRVRSAIELATEGHRDQVLKVSEKPYINHSLGVMLLIADTRKNPDEDTLCAAVDHDLVEDAPPAFNAKHRIRQELGPRVLRIVMDVTKDPSIKDWRACKESQLYNLRHNACPEALVVGVGDAHNIAERNLGDYAIHHEGLWEYFGGDRDGQMWWFDGLHAIYKDRIPDDPLTPMYGELIERLHNLGGQEVGSQAS